MNSTNTIVYVKVAGLSRNGFRDPANFSWEIEKDKKLWSRVSRLGDNRKAIDWHKLSKELEAPEFFLRKRTYRLFAKHLKILEEHIEKRSSQNNAQNLTSEDDKDYDSFTSSETNEDDGGEHMITSKALKNLRSSKILNQHISTLDRTADSSLSELSNLSVSKSALEEALMDRLHL